MRINNRLIFLVLTVFMCVSNVVVSANKPHKYIHTVELDVKIVKINHKNRSILYEYKGKIIESKYTINSYFEKDNSSKRLNEIELNEDYNIMLSFPIDKRESSLQNLDKGIIIFVGRGVYPV